MDEAIRITVEVGPERMDVKSVRRLRMRAPVGQQPEEMRRQQTGRFVELRGDDDRVLYRRHLTSLDARMEFPTGDPARPFGHAELKRPRTVSIIIPAAKGARAAKLMDYGPGRAEREAEAAATGSAGRELLSVDLSRSE